MVLHIELLRRCIRFQACPRATTRWTRHANAKGSLSHLGRIRRLVASSILRHKRINHGGDKISGYVVHFCKHESPRRTTKLGLPQSTTLWNCSRKQFFIMAASSIRLPPNFRIQVLLEHEGGMTLVFCSVLTSCCSWHALTLSCFVRTNRTTDERV